LHRRIANGPTRKFVTLKIDSKTTPAHGGGSLMQGDKVVGTVTSGDWGHRVGLNLAYAFVMPETAAIGAKMQLDLCGNQVEAEVISPSPYDPDYERMQA